MTKNQQDFLIAMLGADGSKALMKAAEREPSLADVLIPRAIVGWLSFVSEHEYEGSLPSIENSYVQFQKSENGFSGNISLNEGVYSFEHASIYHLAASIAMALGVKTDELATDVRDAILVKLGKSIDTLIKAQVLVQELKLPKTLSPHKVVSYGPYHVERFAKSERPYSVIHSKTNLPVQQNISNLRDASEIASWHLKKYQGSFKPKLDKAVLDPKAGYQIHHEEAPGLLRVKATAPNGQVVGHAVFSHQGENLQPSTVAVDEEHQRRGIASAMYDHAEKVSGKKLITPKLQTDEGQAFWDNRQFGKIELPGKTALPKKQEGPVGAVPPQKQPKITQKQPSLAIGKSEAEQKCEICDGHQFENNKFHGCICFRSLNKSIKTTAYSDGYILDFDLSIDEDTVRALMKAFRGHNE